MARRTKHEAQWEGARSPIWWILCGPGALFTAMQYFLPSKGRVVVSGRQYGNRPVQFLFSMVFYFWVWYALTQSTSTSSGARVGNTADVPQTNVAEQIPENFSDDLKHVLENPSDELKQARQLLYTNGLATLRRECLRIRCTAEQLRDYEARLPAILDAVVQRRLLEKRAAQRVD